MAIPFAALASKLARISASGAGRFAGSSIIKRIGRGGATSAAPIPDPPNPVPAIDVRDAVQKFQRGLRQYAKVSRSSLPVILNRRMVFIAKRAHDASPKASRSKIEAELGVVAYRVVKSRKTGQLKKGTFVVKGTRAENIIQGLRKKRGENQLDQKEVKKAARKLIRGRLAAIGALRRGWSAGVRPFQRASGQYATIERGKIKARSQGYPAKPGRLSPKAKLIYRVTINRGGRRVIHPKVSQASAMAFRAETRDMGREVAKRLSKDWSKKRYFK